MTGKACLVTGANTGIGKATALGLARMGASVVMVCRSRERGQNALKDIKQQSGNNSISLLLADLSSQVSIRQLIEDIKSQYASLHVLINNAAVIPRERTVTVDNLETQFAVNHLAYFMVTILLLDLLKVSTPARIVNVASDIHRGASINFGDLQSEKGYRHTRVYAETKLSNILFTYELARRLQGVGVTANCLHPGGIRTTNLYADYMGIPRKVGFTRRIMGGSAEKGARTSLYLATSQEMYGVSGKYFLKRKPVESSSESYDKNVAKRLWEVSAELTGLSDFRL